MVNPQKVRAMSAITLFEQKEGRMDLKIKEYSEDHPIWKGLARNALAGLFLCILILLILFAARPVLLTELVSKTGEIWTGTILALVIAMFAALYSIVSDLIFRRRYLKIRSSLCEYRSDTKQLEKINQEQESL